MSAKSGAQTRQLKQKHYTSFRLSKRVNSTAPRLAPSRSLLLQSVRLLWRHKKLLGGVVAIYAIAQLLLVQGVLAADFNVLASLVNEGLESQWQGVLGGVTLFGYLLGSAGQSVSAEGSVYQSFLLILVSLAIIWALRHIFADISVRIRDTYYKGMYPLVPFLLVLFVVFLQFIPLLVGAWLYQTIVVVGIAVTAVEQLFWLVVAGLFALLTLYMLCSSIMALYIVTLPEMTPMRALRSARGLVLHRRRSVFWRMFILAAVSIAFMALVVIPVIIALPAAAPWVFYIATVFVVAYIHTYMYGLYRDLLRDEG